MPAKARHSNGGKGGGGGGGGKRPSSASKKSTAEAEFEQFLTELSKRTQHVGEERAERAAREEKTREINRQKTVEAVEEPQTKEPDFDFSKARTDARIQQLLEALLATTSPFGKAPVTTFNRETHTTNPNFDVAVGDMQGWRTHMEDAHFVDLEFGSGAASRVALFGVFDGHSGVSAARSCRAEFPAAVLRAATPAGEQHHTIDFERAFLEVDEKLQVALASVGSGCTAVIVYVSPEEITCAWVGDSRAVLCRGGEAMDLSHDHKPVEEAEKARIEAAGGFVRENRVNGQLAMSRAMGDFSYKTDKNLPVSKQLVVPVPDVITTKRSSDEDTYVVLACDGIFDVLSNAELIEFINSKKASGMSNVDICHAVCNRCLAPSLPEGGPAMAAGTDNMTVMIVDLK
ncbi:protein phosphatase 2C [Novymonas esmeraldas]|uniref:Protein phosphatase 2C n=1 Tax=Novymonas esmeraldas TaxID=1808958 RepID=A0AAW0ESS1_9TRYP